jgi:phosphoglycolate phosphatase-like HAD superfamily hydrolase
MKIIFDWDGTIARPDVSKEAAIRRFKTLGHKVDPEWIKNYQKSTDQFKLNRKLVAEYTGITEEKELTIMMTDIFKLHYLGLVNEMKDKVLYDNMRDTIKKLHAKGHKLVIASTLRSDLIRSAMQLLKIEIFFEKVYGNTPDLRYSKRDVVEMAKKNLDGADYVIGDKEEDIQAGFAIKAKTIYVTWGATGSNFKGMADNSVDKVEELLKIIK